MVPSDSTNKRPPSDEFTVVCLCAEWCGTCREYRVEFARLTERFADVRFLWWDIEERGESLGDLEVENFPTILVRRGEWVLFFGTMLPQIGHLARLIETFREQTPEQSRDYARSAPERAGWQDDPDLSSIGRE